MVYHCYNYDFFGRAWTVIRQKQLRSYDAFLANRIERIIKYDAFCKCRTKALVPLWVTDDTPCRLGDGSSMTSLP